MLRSSSELTSGIAATLIVAASAVATPGAWGAQGHRMVALVAEQHLSAQARLNVRWLLDGRTLADVAVWADEYVATDSRTGRWHYVNIPPGATKYDRDRDCPPANGRTEAGSGQWRDCAIDRIRYTRVRLADRSLDRAERGVALKFLVHLIGDLHQPFHALSVGRGGNDTPVVAFGSPTCAYSDGTPLPCNLHAVWDTTLIFHRRLSDRQYVDELSRQISRHRWDAVDTGSPQEWAIESHAAATKALLPSHGIVDDGYYRANISVVDERLALGGLRLAAVLNDALSIPPSE
jgi:hypothetical protein